MVPWEGDGKEAYVGLCFAPIKIHLTRLPLRSMNFFQDANKTAFKFVPLTKGHPNFFLLLQKRWFRKFLGWQFSKPKPEDKSGSTCVLELVPKLPSNCIFQKSRQPTITEFLKQSLPPPAPRIYIFGTSLTRNACQIR